MRPRRPIPVEMLVLAEMLASGETVVSTRSSRDQKSPEPPGPPGVFSGIFGVYRMTFLSTQFCAPPR